MRGFNNGIDNPMWRGGSPERKCLICGKIFHTRLSQIKIGKAKYCSRKCFYISEKNKPGSFWGKKHTAEHIALLRTKTGNKGSGWKGGRTKIKCKKCGKEILRYPSQIKFYCSQKCYGEARIGKIRDYKGKLYGNKNPSWKGGITPMRERIYHSIKYRKWRQDVFIRDNFACQRCGNNTGSNLEAHHNKKSFSRFLEEVKKYLPLFNLYDGAMLYTPLWDLSNGITLCKKCHKKTKNYLNKRRTVK